MRICTVICGHVPEPVRHIMPDYSASFVNLLGPHLPEATFSKVTAVEGERIEDVDGHDVYVFSGSPAGVYEDRPWIRQAEALVRRAVEADKVVLGICFGHQLVAQAFGGRVEKSERGWGMGVHTVEVIEREDWMAPGAETARVNVIVSHQDQVTSPPEGAVVLMATEFCPVGMMRIGDRVLTMQGHPEMQIPIVDAILEMRRGAVGEEIYATGKRSLALPLDHDRLGAWMAGFVRRASGRRKVA